MFLSLRDLRFARGRFSLIAAVVAMITVLVVMLTGLTNGLGHQSISALQALQAPQITLSAGQDGDAPSFDDSRITADQAAAWADADGIDRVERADVGRTQLESPDGGTASVAVLGLQPDTELAGDLQVLDGAAHPEAGEAVLSQQIAESLGVGVGDEITAGAIDLRVAGIAADEWYSHSAVAWTSTEDSPALLHQEEDQSTFLAVFPEAGTTGGDLEDLTAAIDAEQGTSTTDTEGSFAALSAYSSERGSLLMMQGFLYGISALVVISFLAVWSIQRTREVAVLRALGASRGWVLKDALVQSGAVLIAGTGLGLLLGWLGGMAVTGTVPFTLTAATTLLPAAALLVLGMVAAVLAVRRVTTVDPLQALSGA